MLRDTHSARQAQRGQSCPNRLRWLGEKIEKLAARARTAHGEAPLGASSPDLYFPLMDPGECRLCLKLHKMNRK